MFSTNLDRAIFLLCCITAVGVTVGALLAIWSHA